MSEREREESVGVHIINERERERLRRSAHIPCIAVGQSGRSSAV